MSRRVSRRVSRRCLGGCLAADQVDRRDVKSARGDVSRDEDRALSRLERERGALCHGEAAEAARLTPSARPP